MSISLIDGVKTKARPKEMGRLDISIDKVNSL